MADEKLINDIKKLAGVMETNAMLDYELSGYLKDPQHHGMWRGYAKHKVLPKKKLAYIDQDTSGKLLVQTSEESMKQKGVYPKGSVFTIKAYGKKNRYIGDVSKVLAEEKAKQEKLKKMVFERSLKNRRKK